MNRKEIKAWLDEHGVKNYTINEDLTVDVDGSVWLSSHCLFSIPVQFGKVSGYFYCNLNKLTSLEGCPTSVGHTFWCDRNQLTSLKGCPKTVGGGFDCGDNQLTSLEGCPKTVGGNFSCSNNQLTSLEGCPKIIEGGFFCDTNLKKDPRYLRHLLKQKVLDKC